MSEGFRRRYPVRWGDLDGNGHMANVAFLNVAVDVRLSFFAAHGFPASELARLQFGPVVRRDEVEFRKELRLLEEYEVDFMLAGISPRGSHFIIQNGVYRLDGQVAAVVRTTGGWLDLAQRRLRFPPEGLLAAMQQLPRTPDFAELGESARESSG